MAKIDKKIQEIDQKIATLFQHAEDVDHENDRLENRVLRSTRQLSDVVSRVGQITDRQNDIEMAITMIPDWQVRQWAIEQAIASGSLPGAVVSQAKEIYEWICESADAAEAYKKRRDDEDIEPPQPADPEPTLNYSETDAEETMREQAEQEFDDFESVRGGDLPMPTPKNPITDGGASFPSEYAREVGRPIKDDPRA